MQEAAGVPVQDERRNRSRNMDIGRESTLDEKTRQLGQSEEKYGGARNIDIQTTK